MAKKGRSASKWTFLTNHAVVLICIARNPDVRLRDIARSAGLTERAVARITADLENEGYVVVSRVGRRNHYALNPEMPFRHPLVADHQVSMLLELVE